MHTQKRSLRCPQNTPQSMSDGMPTVALCPPVLLLMALPTGECIWLVHNLIQQHMNIARIYHSFTTSINLKNEFHYTTGEESGGRVFAWHTHAGMDEMKHIDLWPATWLNFPYEIAVAYSLVHSLRAPPIEKQSRISWTYSPKVVRTNGTVRLVIIRLHFPFNIDNFHCYSSICWAELVKIFLNVFCYIHSRSGSSLFGLKLFMVHIYEDMSSLHTFGSRAGVVICYSLTSSLLFGVQYISTQTSC